jgi:branched-chain amino acid transport system ATP-binding protein
VELGEAAVEVDGLSVAYGRVRALGNVTLAVPAGSCAAVLGPNGAGKTTLLRAMAGLMHPQAGSVRVLGREVSRLPAHRVARQGVAYVQEGRGVFPRLTVRENLRVVTSQVGDDGVAEVFGYFPRLRERLDQAAGTMSGGEQQMLALSLALLRRPAVLLVDEPSLGLAPLLIREIFDAFVRIRRSGATLVIVEQFVHMVLGMADSVHVLQKGSLVYSGGAAELTADRTSAVAHLMGMYLGNRAGAADGLAMPLHRPPAPLSPSSAAAQELVTVRLPSHYVRWLEDEAARQGRTPSDLLTQTVMRKAGRGNDHGPDHDGY